MNLLQEASFGREVLSLLEKMNFHPSSINILRMEEFGKAVVELARRVPHVNARPQGLIFHAGEVQNPDPDLSVITYPAWVPESPEAVSFFEGIPEDEQDSLEFCVQDFKGVRIFITFEDYKEEEPLCPGTM